MRGIPNPFSVLAWLFLRLPIAFSLPFVVISLFWAFAGFGYLNGRLVEPMGNILARLARPYDASVGFAFASDLASLFQALMVIGLFLVGFVATYNASVFSNWLMLREKLKRRCYSNDLPEIPVQSADASNPFDDIKSIGIVLAGGGAKGAFQAGAMKAIYEYLAEHNALAKVKVISGTSIGSWNALFWLANLIVSKVDGNEQSVHERWWRAISVKSLAAPSWYVPFFRNAILSSAPWQHVFDQIFGRDEVKKQLLDSRIHFYLTRSNVRSAELECVTNNPKPPKIARVTYDILDSAAPDAFMAGVKEGVFASMDLPPLFPYAQRGNEFFEDGGVIDNLPIQFPATEGCDFIFILPLNSDFEETPDRTSILARLLRVMDVRQGALERSGFKLIYLYNELAALRRLVWSLSGPVQKGSVSNPLNYALQRQNETINVFAICPLKSFVQETINTRELWKAKEAAIAFEIMRDATKELLPEFQFKSQDKTRIALVSRGRNIVWDERF